MGETINLVNNFKAYRIDKYSSIIFKIKNNI